MVRTFNPGVVGSNPTGPSTLVPYLMQVALRPRILDARISNPRVNVRERRCVRAIGCCRTDRLRCAFFPVGIPDPFTGSSRMSSIEGKRTGSLRVFDIAMGAPNG